MTELSLIKYNQYAENSNVLNTESLQDTYIRGKDFHILTSLSPSCNLKSS